MNKFTLTKQIKRSEPIHRIKFIENLCRNKTVLDLGCIRHNADVALADPNWLHKKIK